MKLTEELELKMKTLQHMGISYAVSDDVICILWCIYIDFESSTEDQEATGVSFFTLQVE